ncbi:hypothetical protein Q6263_29110, partial [Klebsiella pneumoniae]|uniref:hypothetical protein n=1 Tax=Klebsiella pneumoniae TaxID=573 RepID=UPI0027311CFC
RILCLHQSQARCHDCPDAYANDPTVVALFLRLILAMWNIKGGTTPAIFLKKKKQECCFYRDE